MGGGGDYMSQGTALSGDIVGGIGSLIAAENYKRPRLPPAAGPELRLRQLAQSQLLGGGQQLLGATDIYNQLAPILMGQLPGLSYVPGGDATSGGTGMGATDPSQPGTGAATSSPMQNYQQALQASQANLGRQQQLNALKAQRKALRPGASPQRKALRQQIKTMHKTIAQNPTPAQTDRAQYLAGTEGAINPAMYDVRMGGAGTAGAGGGASASPGVSDSLAAIRQLMQGGSGGQNLMDLYSQGMGGGGAGAMGPY